MLAQHKPGDTAALHRMPEGSPQQNQTGTVCSEVCHLGVLLLLHTRSLSSCVHPCTVLWTSRKLCVCLRTEFVSGVVRCVGVVLSVYMPSYVLG
jgi:hypothetical protein